MIIGSVRDPFIIRQIDDWLARLRQAIARRITDVFGGTMSATDWRPVGFEVSVRNGVVHLHGIITTDEARQATVVAAENTAGVKEVHDHLCYVDTWSGFYVESPEDMKAAS